ncbi:outer membrane protein assembly factor BamB family protein [Streptomyces sp. NBC_01352]|uniref:outer membrane protein assembly factor BamB family protein n=1 Tax=Streptomyces sp. NBC_01352 TaxID=2903834 RepID=UPI002E324193|nr:PQQ-binding-like beta-propeller repeat protein [Streptomyces sp. NBC_01352]
MIVPRGGTFVAVKSRPGRGSCRHARPSPAARGAGSCPPVAATGVTVGLGRENGVHEMKALGRRLRRGLGLGPGAPTALEPPSDGVQVSGPNIVSAGPARQLWVFSPGRRNMSTPAVADGGVHVSSGSGLYALDAATGQERWRFVTSGDRIKVLAPTVADGVVYFGTGHADGLAYAMDALTGRQIWQVATGAPVTSRPAVVDGVVYLSSEQGLSALDAATGERRWVLAGNPVLGSPTVAAGVVYVHIGGSKEDKGVHALDAATGERRWRFTTGREWNEASRPAVADGSVYVTSHSSLHAVDALSGRERWAFYADHYMTSTPAVRGDRVYVGSWDHHLYAVDADIGEPYWKFPTEGAVASSPVLADGLVHFGCWDNTLYTLDAATGASHATFTAGDWVGSPTVADGVVYVGTRDGHLYALRSSAPEQSRDAAN